MSDWIAYTRERPDARLNLFCFPFAGGAASVFRNWQDSLPEAVEVHAIQLPGRETRMQEGLLENIVPIVNGLIEPIGAMTAERPAVFFGHSMGTLVAFELIRALRKRNASLPLHFFAGGRRSPRLTGRFPDIHDLPHDELIQAMRRYGGTPDAILNDPEMMELLLPIIRADFKVLETYHYAAEAPLDLPLTVYGGSADIRTTKAELRAWSAETTGAFALRMFAGEHFFINTHRAEVIAALRADLQEVLDSLPG